MSSRRAEHPWGARMVSLLLSICVTLGFGELALRLFWLKHLFIPAGIEHPHFHHRLASNQDYPFKTHEFDVTIRTNSFGLRGDDPVMPKPEGVTRLLMLGDSFTFGFPIKDGETFSDLIERELNAQGYRVEVVNGGVSGYSPTLHYVSLRDQYLAWEADLVILWLDLGDVQEDAWFQKNLIIDQHGRIVRCDPRYRDGRFDWGEWAKRRSALVKYVDTKILRTWTKIRILGLRGYLAARLRGERSKVAIARLKASQRAQDLGASDRFLLVRESSTRELVEPHWSLTARYIVMIRDLLAERDIPLLLGIYPYGILVGPDQWSEGRAAWGFEQGRTYDPHVAVELLNAFSATAQVPLVNAIDSFREAATTEKLFYDSDGHMTPAGHRVLATYAVRDPAVLSRLRHALAAAAGR